MDPRRGGGPLLRDAVDSKGYRDGPRHMAREMLFAVALERAARR